eukprot:jgi/Psemu1/182214/e_gw1.24.88.1
MIFLYIALPPYSWLCALAFLLYSMAATEANTAILFGATGAVGNEVLQAIIRNNSYFTKLVIVGRSFPPKVTDLLPESTSLQLPQVVKVQLADLGNVDHNSELLALGNADACFIATGSGHPYLYDFGNFHFVEVDMVASMTRLCEKLKVRSLTTFSSIDTVFENAKPYPKGELETRSDGAPMGWWTLLAEIQNIMALKEIAVTDNSVTIPFVRIFQPCNIITEEIRYGWLDWAIFKIQPWIDPWIPTKYHSVNVTLLGMAMVRDAIRLLSGTNTDEEYGATRLTYGDFLRIAEKDFAEWKEEQKLSMGDKMTEL